MPAVGCPTLPISRFGVCAMDPEACIACRQVASSRPVTGHQTSCNNQAQIEHHLGSPRRARTGSSVAFCLLSLLQLTHSPNLSRPACIHRLLVPIRQPRITTSRPDQHRRLGLSNRAPASDTSRLPPLQSETAITSAGQLSVDAPGSPGGPDLPTATPRGIRSSAMSVSQSASALDPSP